MNTLLALVIVVQQSSTCVLLSASPPAHGAQAHLSLLQCVEAPIYAG